MICPLCKTILVGFPLKYCKKGCLQISVNNNIIDYYSFVNKEYYLTAKQYNYTRIYKNYTLILNTNFYPYQNPQLLLNKLLKLKAFI